MKESGSGAHRHGHHRYSSDVQEGASTGHFTELTSFSVPQKRVRHPGLHPQLLEVPRHLLLEAGAKTRSTLHHNPNGTTFFSSLLVFNKPRFLIRLVWKEGSIIKKYFKAISLPHLLMSLYTQVQCRTQWRTWSGKVYVSVLFYRSVTRYLICQYLREGKEKLTLSPLS